MSTDEELYHRVKKGGAKAFDELYERHKVALFSFIYSYLKNREKSEELLQEVFVQVLRFQTVNFEQGSFRAWILRIARNQALNLMRGEKRGQNLVIEEEWQRDMEEVALERELAQSLGKVSATLSPPMAGLLQMKLSGQSNAQIARELNIPEGTVKSRFHALVRYFKTELL